MLKTDTFLLLAYVKTSLKFYETEPTPDQTVNSLLEASNCSAGLDACMD